MLANLSLSTGSVGAHLLLGEGSVLSLGSKGPPPRRPQSPAVCLMVA